MRTIKNGALFSTFYFGACAPPLKGFSISIYDDKNKIFFDFFFFFFWIFNMNIKADCMSVCLCEFDLIKCKFSENI